MQLTQRALQASSTTLLVWLVAATTLAQSGATLTTSVFHEARGPLSSTIVAPSATVEIAPSDGTTLDLAWDADIVSAASIAVVDAPHVDVVSSATQLSDVRNVLRGGGSFALGDVSLRAHYGYGWENDYRAHAASLGAAIDLFDHATRVDLSYAFTGDEICDLAQPLGAAARERTRLPNSAGCFTSERASRQAFSHTLDASIVQALRPDLVVRAGFTMQRIDGFQSSPYREVWLGPWAAQEHHPDARTRGSLSIEGRLALPALSATLRLRGRGYHDDWDLSAASGELAWDQRIDGTWRVLVHGRAFTQSGAAFFSDDYENAPRGEYFTGDRELSPMSSLGGGIRITYTPETDAQGRVLGLLSTLRVALGVEATRAEYPAFHHGRERIPDGAWLLASLVLSGEL